MPTPILTTKVYKPPARPKTVARLRLLERLNAGLPGKLTLISAAALRFTADEAAEFFNETMG